MPAAKTQKHREPPNPLISKWLFAGVLCLAASTALAYSSLFANSFVDFDDPAYITKNAHVRAGLTFDTLVWACKSTRETGSWHPLTWVSHAVDVELFGMNPAGHHFTSLLIHIVNAVLLFLLLLEINKDIGCCFVAATLLALHPLAVESVSWAAERKNVLCTLFFLLAIAAYGRYAKQPSLGRYLWVIVAFVLGLAAKPMVITLPFVLFLLDFWPLGRVEGYNTVKALYPVRQFKLYRLALEKLPLLVISCISAIITLISQSAAGAVSSSTTLPLAARLANAINSYFAYMLAAFWPGRLAPFYPEATIPTARLILSSVFVLVTTAAVWLCRSKRPYLIVGWLFYLGILVPVIGIIQVGTQARADRYTYLPMIGIFVALVWLASDLEFARRLTEPIRVLVPVVLLTTLGVLTWRQVRLWRDDVTLWSYTLKVTKNNVVAEDNLGIALLQEGKTAEALPHFYRAATLNPTDPISTVNVATDLLARGCLREAIAKYEFALMETNAASVPMLLPNIHSNLGFAFFTLGNIEQARDHYQMALRLNPDDRLAQSALRKIEVLTASRVVHQ